MIGFKKSVETGMILIMFCSVFYWMAFDTGVWGVRFKDLEGDSFYNGLFFPEKGESSKGDSKHISINVDDNIQYVAHD